MTIEQTRTQAATSFNILDGITSPLFAVAVTEGNEAAIPGAEALSECHVVAEEFSNNTLSVKSILQQALEDVRFRLNSGLNDVLHQEELRQLEAEWRGVAQLLANTKGVVQIQCVDITKAALAEDMEQVRNERQFYLLTAPPYHTAGDDPFTGVVCSIPINGSSKQDVGILAGMAEVAKDLHFMLMGSLSSETIGLDSWESIDKNTDMLKERFKSPSLAAWNSFRETEAAQYVAISAVRQVARPAYDAKGNPAKGFRDSPFTESVKAVDDMPLLSPAYSMGRFYVSRLADCGLPWSMTSFNNRKSGQTFDLPLPDGSLLVQALEASIDDRHEKILSDMGINTAIHKAKTDNLFYYELCTLFDPSISPSMSKEEKRDATRLRDFQVVAVTQRFAHCIQELERQGLGATVDLEERSTLIGAWLDQYTTGVAKEAGTKPLKARIVSISEDEEDDADSRLLCDLELYFHTFSTGTKVTVHLK